MPIDGMLIAAALGAAKTQFIDKPAADKQRTLAAAETRWSPWTGIKGQVPTDPNIGNGILGGAAMGLQAGSAYDKDQAQSKLTDAMTKNVAAGGGLGGSWLSQANMPDNTGQSMINYGQGAGNGKNFWGL